MDSSLATMDILAPDEEFDRRPSIAVPETARQAVAERLGAEHGSYLVVNISTGSPTRRWPEEKWTELVRQIEWPGNIAVLSAPADVEAGERVAAVRPDARYIRTGNLMEAAAVIGGSAGMITSDTSVVHIASALNIPIVALYFRAPRMLKKFAPLSDVQHVLIAPGEEPVEVIPVDEVLAAVNELIERIGRME